MCVDHFSEDLDAETAFKLSCSSCLVIRISLQ